MPRPILFLDFDGVFLTHRGALAQTPPDVRLLPGLPGARMMLDITALGLIAHAVKETDAEIVISSTWRRGGRDDCVPFLQLVGIESHLHQNWHTAIDDRERGVQVLDWLDANDIDPMTPVAVIDDDSEDIALHLGDRLILTEGNEGITFRQALELVELLQRPRGVTA